MLNKKVVESFAVLAICGALTITAVTGNGATVDAAETAKSGDNVEVNTSLGYDVTAGLTAVLSGYQVEKTKTFKNTAGLTAVLSDYQAEVVNDYMSTVSVTEEEGEMVSATAEEAASVSANDSSEETSLTEEEKEWQDKLMADVDEFLYVRAKADSESDIVGKMFKGDRATIVEKGDEWTEIKSGNVKGYVKNEYCLMGQDAYDYAKKNCETVAKVNIDGLRIRSEQSTDATVIDAVSKGTKLKVNTKAEVEEGWVAVKYNSETRYVSAEYVTVKLNTGSAVTLEEEQAEIAAAEAAKAAAQTASTGSSSSQKSSSGTKSGKSVAASADDVTLLAALIQCEAGGCSYETQLAVGAVVVNRMKSGSYPGSIYKVIYQRAQFGPASSGKLERTLSSGSISKTSKKAAKAALAGKDNTSGAKCFKLASTGHKGVKIGPIVFY